MENGGPIGPLSILFWCRIKCGNMWWSGQVTAKALKKEILRRERVKRVKELIHSYNDMRMAARYTADWMYHWSGVEFWRGYDDEADWYREKCGTICKIEDDCTDAASDLYRRFQRDLIRDIQYPPRF